MSGPRMDVAQARVVFRERAILDVFDLSLRFVVVHHRPYARLAAVVLLPAFTLSLGAAAIGGWVWGWLVVVALSSIAQLPFTLLASRLVFQDEIRIREVLRATIADVPRVVVMRALSLVVFVMATMFFVIPAIWLATAVYFTNEVVLLERATILSAFGRSQRVSASSVGESLVAILLAATISLLAIVLADFGGRAVLGELLQVRPPLPVWENGGSTLALVGWFGALPYLTTARLFAYLNIRTKTEGWDIQTRFSAVAARAASEAE